MHESNIEAKTSLFYDAWNRGDEKFVRETVAPDALNHGSGDVIEDHETFMHSFLAMRLAFPDLQYTVHEIVVDSQRQLSVTNVVCEGTQAGEFVGHPPSHRRARWREMRMARWREGRIVEHWTVRDGLAILTQLGYIDVEGYPHSPN